MFEACDQKAHSRVWKVGEPKLLSVRHSERKESTARILGSFLGLIIAIFPTGWSVLARLVKFNKAQITAEKILIK